MSDAIHAQPRPDEDEKYSRYRQTVLEFCGDGPRIDLRRPVDDAARRALAARGLGDGFAVLTAENPHGMNEEDAPSGMEERARERANDRRAATLMDELKGAGLHYARVDGVAPAGDYRERCVAVAGDRATGTALALQWRQLALFWYDGSTFWLLPAEADQEPQRLP